MHHNHSGRPQWTSSSANDATLPVDSSYNYNNYSVLISDQNAYDGDSSIAFHNEPLSVSQNHIAHNVHFPTADHPQASHSFLQWLQTSANGLTASLSQNQGYESDWQSLQAPCNSSQVGESSFAVNPAEVQNYQSNWKSSHALCNAYQAPQIPLDPLHAFPAHLNTFPALQERSTFPLVSAPEYKCLDCNDQPRFSSQGVLDRHRTTVEAHQHGETEFYWCICGYKQTRKDNFTRHLKLKALKGKCSRVAYNLYICKCGRRCEDPLEHMKHVGDCGPCRGPRKSATG